MHTVINIEFLFFFGGEGVNANYQNGMVKNRNNNYFIAVEYLWKKEDLEDESHLVFFFISNIYCLCKEYFNEY